jgi:hypothetical protein
LKSVKVWSILILINIQDRVTGTHEESCCRVITIPKSIMVSKTAKLLSVLIKHLSSVKEASS